MDESRYQSFKTRHFYEFLHRQILVMLGLSLGPGLGYILLGVIYDVPIRTIAWYLLMVLVSAWGYRLYRQFNFHRMDRPTTERWYKKLTYFYYSIFSLWSLIFILVSPLAASNLHYVALFTQIGASVVSAALLFSDRRLYQPIAFILVIPLTVFFALLGTWYGYVLTVFSLVFLWVLNYSASSSHQLLSASSFQATHDQLTGLFNRAYFIDVMQQILNTLKSTQTYSCILLLDLDHFKSINDSLGHDVGDSLLQEAAQRMRDQVSEDGVVARMGGDEFIVIGGIYESEQACTVASTQLAENLRSELKKPYLINQHELRISASIGISKIRHPDKDANHYIKEADIAMYEVKDKGRDGIVVFGDEVSQRVGRKLQVEQLIHKALANREFHLNFQPQLNRAHRIVGCEVLVRWQSPELGLVSPVEFIPIAEKTGQILEIGSFVMEEAFRILSEWQDQGIDLAQMSINVSMRQVFNPRFIDQVEHLLDEYLDSELSNQIVFELTESTLAEGLDELTDIMAILKERGISFSIDDFGTGYSSLSYLRKIPIDEIKIDRSFIEELTENAMDRNMVDMILNLARVFDLNVVAEGIEKKDQERLLLDSECDLLQGFLFSKPLAREAFERLYRDNLQHNRIYADDAPAADGESL